MAYFFKVCRIAAWLSGALSCAYYGWRSLPSASAFLLFFGGIVFGLWGAMLVRKLLWETGA